MYVVQMRSAEMWVPSNPNSPLSSLPPVHVHKSQSGHTDHYKFLGFCRVQVQVVVITPVWEMPDLISVGCFIIVLYHSYYCGTASKFDSVVGSVNERADIEGKWEVEEGAANTTQWYARV